LLLKLVAFQFVPRHDILEIKPNHCQHVQLDLLSFLMQLIFHFFKERWFVKFKFGSFRLWFILVGEADVELDGRVLVLALGSDEMRDSTGDILVELGEGVLARESAEDVDGYAKHSCFKL